MKRIKTAFLIILCLSMFHEAYAAIPTQVKLNPNDAKSVQQYIDQRGARKFNDWIWNDTGAWSTVLDNIGKGQPEWLKIDSELLPASDAGITETLLGALSSALAYNPAGVLELMNKGVPGFPKDLLDTEDICSMPQEEILPSQLNGVYVNYQKQKKALLREVTNPGLLEARDKCLKSLKKDWLATKSGVEEEALQEKKRENCMPIKDHFNRAQCIEAATGEQTFWSGDEISLTNPYYHAVKNCNKLKTLMQRTWCIYSLLKTKSP